MKLNEKIAYLRKRQGWSQEELAERMDVSRQAVSKWESGASVPELERIVQMCALFDLTADAMIRDELGPDEGRQDVPPDKSDLPALSLDDVYAYIAHCRTNAHRLALGVAACVLSPAPMLLLQGFFSSASEAIGLSVLLLIVAWAVYAFITCGSAMQRYAYIERRKFTLEPGVREWIRESREQFRPAFAKDISIGVMLCIISPAPLLFLQSFFSAAVSEGLGVGLLLALVALGVYLFVRSGSLQNCYHRLLKGR